jgi:hypothetical protein
MGEPKCSIESVQHVATVQYYPVVKAKNVNQQAVTNSCSVNYLRHITFIH